LKLLFILGSILCYIPNLYAVQLHSSIDVILLGKHIEVLEDQSTSLTIYDLQDEKHQKNFKKSKDDIPNYGFSKSVFWVRFQLQNPTYIDNFWLLELAYPYMDSMWVYILQKKKVIQVEQLGDLLPFSSRTIPHRNFVVKLKINKQEKKWVYLRLESSETLQFPLKIWSPKAFYIDDHDTQYFLGIYYGIMLSVVFYSYMILLTFRNKAHFYYVLFISFYFLFQTTLGGFALEYLWPNHPLWAKYNRGLFIALTLFFAILFTKHFLNTKKNTPLLSKVLDFFTVLCFIVVFISIFGDPFFSIQVALFLAIILPIPLILTGIIRSLHGDKSALYYVIGWGAMFIGELIVSLKALGFLPSVFITEYGAHVGSLCQVFFLSVSLSERFRRMKKEREENQRKALFIEQKNNQILEEKVQQRTQELQSLLEDSLQKEGILTKNNKVIQRANSVFHGLVNLHSLNEETDKIEEIILNTVTQLKDLFSELDFGVILFGERFDIVENAVFLGFSKKKQNYIFSNIESVLLPEKKSPTSRPEADIFPHLPIYNQNSRLQVLPMINREKKIIGKFMFIGEIKRRLTLEVINLFIEQLTSITDHKTLTRRLEQQANTDGMTSTYNRSYLERKLNDMVETSLRIPDIHFAIFLIDVNGLKRVNDEYGHGDGDKMIIKVADLLLLSCRKSDIVARLGGDEFVVLCPSTKNEEANNLLSRIREEEEKLFMHCRNSDGSSEKLKIRMSIGVASTQDTEPNNILALSDQRMYQDKELFYKKEKRYR
jgi:diguanylate cyclase (GGDEF)-like protein